MRSLSLLAVLFAGLVSSHAAQTIFPTNATWRLFKGLSEASSPDNAGWRLLGFDDSAAGWVSADGAFYYDSDVNPATGYTGSTQLPDMNGSYGCIFLRKTFVVTNPSEVSSMTLSAWSDDGFIAWINGTEVTRYNMPAGFVAYNGASLAALGEPVPVVDHQIPSPQSLLVPGTNIIAIQAFNSSIAGSSDFVISASLRYEIPDVTAPVISSKNPAPGTVNSLGPITVTFSEPVLGVNAADLLASGVPASSVTSADGISYTFTFPPIPYGNVQISWVATPAIVDMANPPNPFNPTGTGATWTYNNVDQQAPTMVFRSPTPGTTIQQLNAIQINFSEPVIGVDTNDLLINGQPAWTADPGPDNSVTFQFPQPPLGTVTVAFAVSHGITDTASPPNAFAGGNWTYNLATTLTQFRISEFMAESSGLGINGIRDEDLASSDWIEIYNPDLTPGDLSGWYLSDRANIPTMWKFPNGTTVPAQGYIIVWASGKNRTNNVNLLHTSFSLNNGGEFLGLFDPRTNAVSIFSPAYPAQSQDVSYGRDRSNPNFVGYYNVPTPGSNNVVAGVAFMPEVEFSRPSSSFVGSFPLVLSVDNTNAEIRYTIVNSAQNISTSSNTLPTQASTLYTGPITINNTVTVRARAFPKTTNYFPGEIKSQSYIQLGPGASNYVGTLPVMVLHTYGATTISSGNGAFDNEAIFAVYQTNANGVVDFAAQQPALVKRSGINYRGSSTQFGTGFPKGSLSVELWDEFNQDEENPVLDLPKESDWVLYAPNQFDIGLLHNPLMHQWAIDMGYYSSRTRLVELFFRQGPGAVTLNTNANTTAMGDYWGVYVLEESVKRDGNRVDIDELEPQDTNAPAITGGYVLKIDRVDANERTFVGGGETIVYQDPNGLEMVTPLRTRQANYIRDYLNFFNASITGTAITNATGTNHYSNYLDVEETIDLHIVNVLTLNVDGYRLSGFLYKPREGKLVLGPLWDCDRGQGTTARGGDVRAFNPRCWQAAAPLGASDYGTDFFQGTTPPAWLGRLFGDVDFWQKWIDRYQHWRGNGVLDTNRMNSVIDQFGNIARRQQPLEQRRWAGQSGSDTTPRTGTSTYGGYTHTFSGTYQGEIDFQKRWYVDRVNFFDTNLLGRPTFSVAPGQINSGTQLVLVDNSAKANTAIFYTLDGSDPRAPQGLTNPAAIRYTGPITITNNVRVRARAVNATHSNMTGLLNGVSRNPVRTSTWSGDNSGTFWVQTPTLAVSEIMFNPSSPSVTDTNDPDVYEFIELKNVGTSTINLTGFRFIEGIDYTFSPTSGVTSLAPGAYVLLVANQQAFVNRYGPRSNIAGTYSGQLDNAGERLVLVGPALEPVLDFTYGDAWHDLADGSGFSLVLVNESTAGTNYTNSASWRISNIEGGSPGNADPGARLLPRIIINEALTHTDLPAVDVVEIQNLEATNVNIGGWFLSDSFDNSKKYVIPSTMIPPGGFVTFSESNFNIGGNGFALGSEGDDIYIFSGDGTKLTGYYHGFDFGPAANGVTFGRYVNSQTNEHFVAQSVNSLGATNVGPRIGPIVITEIHYHPPESGSVTNLIDNTLDEFIELRNITGAAVQLYDSMHPSNTWRLSKGADFQFPPNVTINANSYLLVVNFNPANSLLVNEFRSKFGVPAGVPIYGPYGGKLDNSAESVKISRPDAPNPLGGFVPYIEVDQIDYTDTAPWAGAADGFGPSLQRVVNTSYGNDPTNWVAGLPTPGNAFTPGAAPVITQQPSGGSFIEGTTMQLSVTAVGAQPLGYQWRFKTAGDTNAASAPVPGGTNAVLQIQNVQPYHGGEYSVAVFNAGGAVISQVATVTVAALPRFTIQPLSVQFTQGVTATIIAAASGTGPLQYQWRYEGQDIQGQISSNLVIPNVDVFQHSGVYDVRVTDSIGTTYSDPAILYVIVRPVVTNAPVPVTVLAGETAYFSAVVGPQHPLVLLTNTWAVIGAIGTTTNTSGTELYIFNATNSGSVRFRVSGSGGQVQITSGLTVTVLADGDRDGMADAWESQYGFSSGNALDATLDTDGDGMINRAEYVAGTNPTNALSLLELSYSLAGNAPVLQFNAVSNRVYELQAVDSLSTSQWATVFTLPPTNNNRLISVTNSPVGPGTNRFYRVSVPKFP